ncbi:MAG: hypothetical protein ACI4KG_05705 [Oscillospiraceae bacterium]
MNPIGHAVLIRYTASQQELRSEREFRIFLGKVGESDGEHRAEDLTDSPQRLVCSYTLRKV